MRHQYRLNLNLKERIVLSIVEVTILSMSLDLLVTGCRKFVKLSSTALFIESLAHYMPMFELVCTANFGFLEAPHPIDDV